LAPQLNIPTTRKNQPPIDPKVDPLPSSSVVSSSPYSSSLGKSIDTSNQVDKKKNKGRNEKKKKIQQGETKQPFLRKKMLMRNHKISLKHFDILENFLWETIFFKIVLVFLRS